MCCQINHLFTRNTTPEESRPPFAKKCGYCRNKKRSEEKGGEEAVRVRKRNSEKKVHVMDDLGEDMRERDTHNTWDVRAGRRKKREREGRGGYSQQKGN